MKNKIYLILSVLAVFLVGAILLGYPHNQVLGDAATAPSYASATNSSSTCGQLATGNIVFGATSSSVSTATSTVFVIAINGTVVTSTATATTTALALANSLATNIPSSTLGMSVGTSTNGTTVQINATSTVWGKPVTIVASPLQLGLTLTGTSGAASTQIVGGSSGRYYFSATDNTSNPNPVYLCKSASCLIHTGYAFLSTSSASYVQTGADPYNGAYSCISATASSSELDYISAQ